MTNGGLVSVAVDAVYRDAAARVASGLDLGDGLCCKALVAMASGTMVW